MPLVVLNSSCFCFWMGQNYSISAFWRSSTSVLSGLSDDIVTRWMPSLRHCLSIMWCTSLTWMCCWEIRCVAQQNVPKGRRFYSGNLLSMSGSGICFIIPSIIYTVPPPFMGAFNFILGVFIRFIESDWLSV